MNKKVIPLVAALGVAAFLISAGTGLLPGGLRLQTGGSLVSNGQEPAMNMDNGKPSAVGLAPSPVLNPPANAARLTVDAAPAQKTDDGYVLTVQVKAPDGKPLGDAPVKVFDIVDLFGPREMILASLTTDGRGYASYTYLPSTVGTHSIVVRSSSREGVRAGEARTTFEASITTAQPGVEGHPLASFTDRIPYAVGLIVLAVWALIGFALFGTARGVIDGARRTRGKEELA